jgi:hypothetical protein
MTDLPLPHMRLLSLLANASLVWAVMIQDMFAELFRLQSYSTWRAHKVGTIVAPKLSLADGDFAKVALLLTIEILAIGDIPEGDHVRLITWLHHPALRFVVACLALLYDRYTTLVAAHVYAIAPSKYTVARTARRLPRKHIAIRHRHDVYFLTVSHHCRPNRMARVQQLQKID